MKAIEILIPFHNSYRLKSVVENVLFRQEYPSGFTPRITIVASGCTEEAKRYAKSVVSESRLNGAEIELILEDIPGKAIAMNKGLQNIESDIVVSICDDVEISKNGIFDLFRTLNDNHQIGAVSLWNVPSYPEKNKKLALAAKYDHDRFYKYENSYIIGRAMSFRKSILGKFDEDIISDDFYLQLVTKQKGHKIKVIKESTVTYDKPKTLKDYFKMIKRYDFSFKQLRDKYPNDFKKYIHDSTNEKHLVRKTFEDLGVKNKDYIPISARILYISFVIYRNLVLKVEYKLKPPRSGYFSREESTIT